MQFYNFRLRLERKLYFSRKIYHASVWDDNLKKNEFHKMFSLQNADKLVIPTDGSSWFVEKIQETNTYYYYDKYCYSDRAND